MPTAAVGVHLNAIGWKVEMRLEMSLVGVVAGLDAWWLKVDDSWR